MRASVDRTTALRLLAVEHEEVRALIDALTDAEMTQPDTIQYGIYPDQELSFKDLLAHLICYEAYALQALEAWRSSEKHPVIDRMRDPRQARHIHYTGIQDRRGMSLHEVLDEWEDTHSELMEALETLSDAEWYTPAPFQDTEDTDLGGMLEEILVAPPRPMYRHLPVHIPDSDAYIRRLRG